MHLLTRPVNSRGAQSMCCWGVELEMARGIPGGVTAPVPHHKVGPSCLTPGGTQAGEDNAHLFLSQAQAGQVSVFH